MRPTLAPAVLVLAACGASAAPAPAPSATPTAIEPGATVLFPEHPELDAIVPSPPYVFKQETWTEITTGAQHCREWAFPADAEPALRERAFATLPSLGVTPGDGYLRGNGIAFAIGSVGSDGTTDPQQPLVKLTACTERSDTVPALRAYLARITAAAADSAAARAIDLQADVAWEREHASGRRQIGIRVRDVFSPAARPALERAGFVASPGTWGATDLVLAGERVRFIGERVWWQGDVAR